MNPIQNQSRSRLGRLLHFPQVAGVLAVMLVGSLSASGAQATYRYFRFKPIAISNSGTDLQLSEFTFSLASTPIAVTGVVVTSLGANFVNEGPQNLVDGSFDTKLFRNLATTDGNEVIFDFGTATTIDSYNFATGNDNVLYANRTPVSWRLAGSNDQTNWVVVDIRSNVPALNADKAFNPTPFALQDKAPPVINSYSIHNTVTEGTAAIVLNGQSVTFDYNTSDSTTRLLAYGKIETPLSAEVGSSVQVPPNNATTPYTLVAAQGDPKVSGTRTATSTILVRSVAGGSATYKHVRYTVTGRRGGGGGLVQVSEMEFFNGDSSVAANKKTILTATNPGGRNAVDAGEGANKLFDGSPTTKWLDNNPNVPVIFHFGDTAVTFDRYRFVTGGDATERDPIAWTLEGSNDENAWDLIEKVDFGYPTPAARNFSSREIPLPGASLPAQIDTFAASPTTLIAGESLTISHAVRAVNLATDTIVLTDSNGSVLPAITTASGSTVLSGTSAPTSNTTYTLTVTKPGGSVVTRTFDITVVPDPGVITVQFDNFASAAGSFQFVGSPAITAADAPLPNRLRLTPATPGQLGAAWILKKQNLTQGFEATFGLSMNINVPSPGAPPADGTAFVIQSSPSGNGNPGTGEGGVSTNALNICFRTYGFAADPASRIEVRSGADVLAFAIADTTPGIKLYGVPGWPYSLASQAADPAYRIRVVYVPGDLDVYLDGVAVIQNLIVNLETIGATDSNGGSYIGFTGRTGGNVQNNDITDWHLNVGNFSASPPFGIVKTLFKSSTRTGPIDTLDIVWNAVAANDYEVLGTFDLTLPQPSWSPIGALRIGLDGQQSISIPLLPDESKRFFSVHEIK